MTEERISVGVNEAARMLGVSTKTVYRAVWSGDLPSSKMRGKVLIPTQAIRNLFKEVKDAKST